MKISFSTIPGNLRTDTGYGFAAYNMIRSLQALGHEVPFMDKSAAVQIHFSQPTWYNFQPHQYKIGYTPWESSALPEGWLEEFNKLDELWTTSEQCKVWYEEAGVEVPVHVYLHGVNGAFTPRKRTPRRKIRFLHIGEPAPRKAGQLVVDSFVKEFAGHDDVHLTVKCFSKMNTTRFYGPDGMIMGPPDSHPHITLDMRSLSTEELVQLYHSHDVLVYPSWGEGFGLIPLEALATGMPTICTEAWAPYKEFILPLESRLADSPWPLIHTGKMFEPSEPHLRSLMREVYSNYDKYSDQFYSQVPEVNAKFDWLKLTENAFKHVAKKFP